MSENISIRKLAAPDVTGVSRCFERCYGTSYVVGDFYVRRRSRRESQTAACAP